MLQIISHKHQIKIKEQMKQWPCICTGTEQTIEGYIKYQKNELIRNGGIKDYCKDLFNAFKTLNKLKPSEIEKIRGKKSLIKLIQTISDNKDKHTQLQQPTIDAIKVVKTEVEFFVKKIGVSLEQLEFTYQSYVNILDYEHNDQLRNSQQTQQLKKWLEKDLEEKLQNLYKKSNADFLFEHCQDCYNDNVSLYLTEEELSKLENVDNLEEAAQNKTKTICERIGKQHRNRDIRSKHKKTAHG